jgi:hypothetical protein
MSRSIGVLVRSESSVTANFFDPVVHDAVLEYIAQGVAALPRD